MVLDPSNRSTASDALMEWTMAATFSELRLVLLAQCGDPDALEALLLGLQPALSHYVAGLAGESDADDVLQEVFLQIWRNLKWLRRPELFRPWAYRIATRACYAQLRRVKRWGDRIDDAAVADDLPAASDVRTGLIGGPAPWLQRVSPASRAVLLLHYMEDLSIEDTASILDISVGTAKSRLAYGLTCLRGFINPKGPLS
jgi:RNA polymerase sigma-70 factor (ECF subfamily)